MSEALERLKDIGAQKIYEDTHIPVEHVQAILHKSFDGLNKMQFAGFISILEREYGEDLSEIRLLGMGYLEEKASSDEVLTNTTIFKPSSKKKSFTIAYILVAIFLLLVAIFYTTQSASESIDGIMQESKIIKDVKKNILADVNRSDADDSEQNSSEQNSSDANITVPSEDGNMTSAVTSQPKAITHSFTIIARKKVWLGYIDVFTNKKHQKTFKGEFTLDPAKEWLLYFGHGYVDIIVDGEKEEFSSRNTLRLYYKEGNVSKVSINEFRKLNRGSAW